MMTVPVRRARSGIQLRDDNVPGILQSVGYHNNGDPSPPPSSATRSALAGVKVDDVDTYHPFPCKTPTRTIRPVPGGLIKRRVSRLKELIRRYRRVLEPDRAR
jgi:hypothetical protein